MTIELIFQSLEFPLFGEGVKNILETSADNH